MSRRPREEDNPDSDPEAKDKAGTTVATGSKRARREDDWGMYEAMANQLRIDCAKAVRVTKSGHPTSSSSIAEILAVLFFHPEGMKIHANDHKHFLNDRLVLSKGHAAPGLYAALYRANIISEKELMSLRLKDSIIQGHPVPGIPFVDVATGSLGQGLSVAAGMAYSSKYFDKIPNKVYCIVGDGETAEGSIWEALSFANFYELNNLIVFIDVNALGQSQQTMFKHDTQVYRQRCEAFGCNSRVIDGHSPKALVNALIALNREKKKPSVIICRTEKGKNFSEAIQGKLDWHGKDLGEKFEESIANLQKLIGERIPVFTTFPPASTEIPSLAQKPIVVKPNYPPGSKISSRKAYGNGLVKAYESNNNVVGLDGDTKNSTFSIFLHDKYPANFIECYIAEQNMIGVATGLACRNKIPFVSAFACFLERGADQIRIAGISKSKIKLVGSHSGCSIGEDGPSQMALEDLAFFRAIPHCLVLVPSDGVSAEKAVELAGNYSEGPVFVRTARPDTPVLYANEEEFELGKCIYADAVKVLRQSEGDRLAIIAIGVLVNEAVQACERLRSEGTAPT